MRLAQIGVVILGTVHSVFINSHHKAGNRMVTLTKAVFTPRVKPVYLS